jgi:hypothetical protein
MPSTTQSTTSPDPILQTINDHLLTITQDLNTLCQDVTDLKTNIAVFQTDLPHKLETIDTLIAVLEQAMNHRIDTLTLKTADVAVELSKFQQSTQDQIDSIVEDPLTFTPIILSSIETITEMKLQDYRTSSNKNY